MGDKNERARRSSLEPVSASVLSPDRTGVTHRLVISTGVNKIQQLQRLFHESLLLIRVFRIRVVLVDKDPGTG